MPITDQNGNTDGSVLNTSIKYRGAQHDYNRANGKNTGLMKRLTLLFPLPEKTATPDGAIPDNISLDAAGKTKSAMFSMFVNPDQVQVRYPTRSQVVQTLGGIYIDSFGYGAPTGTISGSFGWGLDPAAKDNRTGLDRMGTLRNLYYGWQKLTTTMSVPCQLILVGNERTSNLNFLVFWGDLEITRSKSQPFIIDYTLPFTVLRDYDGPDLFQIIPPIGTALEDGATPPASPDRTHPNT